MHVKIPQIDYPIVYMLSALKFCKSCKLRPVPLAYYNVVGELKCELGGIYLPYVKCLNTDCGVVKLCPIWKNPSYERNGLGCRALLLIRSLEQLCDGFSFY